MRTKRHVDLELLKALRTLPCACCLAPPPSEVSHIATRGSGAGDYDYNCLPSCRRCHALWHQYGPSKFFEKNPQFLGVLTYMGWEWDGRKLTHPRRQETQHGEG